MTRLGTMGRFGNQLFQYAVAKTYAEKNNCILEIPAKWIGRKIFEIEDASISCTLPRNGRPNAGLKGEVNVDIQGYYQHQRFIDNLNPNDIRKWFTFKKEWTEFFKKPKEFYIACHLRRGDFIHRPGNCIIPEKSYLDSVKNYGYDVKDVVWVSEENRLPFDPNYGWTREVGWSSEAKPPPNWGPGSENSRRLGFLYDFYVLTQADVLFRSNSTFAWWAGFLGNQKKVYSPFVQGKSGFPRVTEFDFVEGNHPCHMEIDAEHSDLYL